MLIVACRASPAPSTIGNNIILGLTAGQCQACAGAMLAGSYGTQIALMGRKWDTMFLILRPGLSLTASSDSAFMGRKARNFCTLPYSSHFLFRHLLRPLRPIGGKS